MTHRLDPTVFLHPRPLTDDPWALGDVLASLRRGADHLRNEGGTGFFLPADQWVLLADYIQLLQIRTCPCAPPDQATLDLAVEDDTIAWQCQGVVDW